MRWMTRKYAKVDRIACPWLISRFVDPEAEFVFLPPETDWTNVSDGIVFDVPDCELGHHGAECSFDAIVKKYGLADPALQSLARIVRAADTNDKSWAPEGAGLEATRTVSGELPATITTTWRSSFQSTTRFTRIVRRD